MKDELILKTSSSFAKKHDIRLSSHRSLISFIRNIDSEYLKDKGEAECLSFLFDIVESSRSEYGNLLLNELKYLFDCNEELVGSRLLFNMLLNRDLNKLITKGDFRRINKMLNKVANSYIEDKMSYSDYSIGFFNDLTRVLKRTLKDYMDEYMDGEGGYYVSYSIEGLKKVFVNVIKEYIMFSTGIYKQILKYQIDEDAIEKYRYKHLEDLEDIFNKKLEDTIMSFENTVDHEMYESAWGAAADAYERKMNDINVDTTNISQAYMHLIDEVTSYKIDKETAILDITTEGGMYKLNKLIEKEAKKMISSFTDVLEVELNSYVEETNLTLDVLISEYMENIISNVIFTLILSNVLMFIHTEPLNNRTGKAIMQRLTREIGFLNLLNDSLDISFDVNTDKYIRTDWCE